MSVAQQHKCVFVGNIPYDATEEQLVAICEEVGPVVNFRLVTDRETGKPKGYGFCEFRDEETALSARRNLSGYDLNGRQLRVDFAENEKGSSAGDRAPREQAPRGPPAPGPPPAPPVDTIGYSAAAQAAGVMAGALGSQAAPQNGGNPAGLGNDALTSSIANMSRHQLYEIMCQLKALVQKDQQQARQLLITHPSLTKALFQAQIMLGMVRIPQARQQPSLPPVSAPIPSQNFISPPPPPAAYSQQPSVLPQAPPPLPQQPRPPPMPPQMQAQQMNFQGPPPPYAQQPPYSMGMPFHSQGQPPLPHQPPPQHSFQHPNMNMERNYQPPPPFGMDGGPPPMYGGQMQMQGPPPPPPPPQQMPLEMEQQHLLQQVMNLTPEQINSLPPDQRQQVLQLQQAMRFRQ